jgi:Tfp pilus assembly pilus retraction ATPase PilT
MDREPEINKLFRLAGRYEADLYLSPGEAPQLRVGGVLRKSQLVPLSEKDLEYLLQAILNAEQVERWERGKDVAFAYTCEEGCVFRVKVSGKPGPVRVAAFWQKVT